VRGPDGKISFKGVIMSRYPCYQDYVIKDGRFIGEFEEMYRDFEDPWEQSERERYAIEKIIGLEILSKYGHRKPLEYGCGLGFYTNRLYERFGCGGALISRKQPSGRQDQDFQDQSFMWQIF